MKAAPCRRRFTASGRVDPHQKDGLILLHGGDRLAPFGRLAQADQFRGALKHELRDRFIGVVRLDRRLIRSRVSRRLMRILTVVQCPALDGELQNAPPAYACNFATDVSLCSNRRANGYPLSAIRYPL